MKRIIPLVLVQYKENELQVYVNVVNQVNDLSCLARAGASRRISIPLKLNLNITPM